MTSYQKIIQDSTGCSDAEVEELEDIVRDVIFDGYLDSKTREQIMLAAREAVAVREGMDVKDLDF